MGLVGSVVVSGLSSIGVVGGVIGLGGNPLGLVSEGAIASVAGLSDGLADWGRRCIVVDSVNSEDETLGLAGSVVVSGLSSIGVVEGVIGLARDSLAWVFEGAIASVSGISDALSDCGCCCIVVDSREAAVGLALLVVPA